MDTNRRSTDDLRIEGAYGLAVMFTVGYLALMGGLMFFEIPASNRELLISLVGIMSAAELGIIKYYYDGSKGAQQVQQANIARSMKNDAVVQDLAKTAPATAAAAVAAATGAAPAKSVLDTAGVKTDTMNVTAEEVNVAPTGDTKP